MKQIWYQKSRLAIVIGTLLLMASCIDGYKDDWTFSAGVKNSILSAPDSTQVTFAKQIKGDSVKLIVTWPVVLGAGGYQFTLYNVDDPLNPVPLGEINQVIDGCTVTRPLDDDTKYKVVIKTMGNALLNNTTDESVATAHYSTLLPARAIIPTGTDLYTYFSNTVLPDTIGEIAYELEAGGTYSLSGPIDFQKHWLTLRGDKIHHPTITYGPSGRFRTTAGFTLKYLDIDCNSVAADATDGAMLLMSSNPDPSILNSAYNSYYILKKDIYFLNCNFKNVNRRLVYDSNVKYCFENLIIKNCVISLNALNDANGGIIYMQSGFANNFYLINSTVYGNTKTAGYFLRYNNSGRPDRAGYAKGNISFTNNTFYNVVYSGQMGNYSGMSSSLVTLTLKNNIFVDCGSSNVVRRLSVSSTNMQRQISNNCYWFDGAFPQANEIDLASGDKSGSEIKEDPAFLDPTKGDFHLGSSATTIISKKTGDPRWLPTGN